MKLLRSTFIPVSFLLVLTHAPAVDTESLEKEWKWVRENPKEWKLADDGSLRLRTQPGRIWAGNDARNILVRALSTGNGPPSIKATVTLEEPSKKYEQGGLLVYIDDDQFVKFVVEFIDGKYYVVLAREFAKKRKVLAKIEIKSGTARLRFEVKSGEVHGFYKTDLESSDWLEAAQTELPSKRKRYFALFTQDGPADKTNWARFEDIELK